MIIRNTYFPNLIFINFEISKITSIFPFLNIMQGQLKHV